MHDFSMNIVCDQGRLFPFIPNLLLAMRVLTTSYYIVLILKYNTTVIRRYEKVRNSSTLKVYKRDLPMHYGEPSKFKPSKRSKWNLL